MDDDKISSEAARYIRIAVNQSLEITITFLLDRCPISQLRGVCSMLKKRHFIVSMPVDELNSHPVMGGGEVRCRFVLREPQRLACTFGSRLCRTFLGSDNIAYLVFELPMPESGFGRLVDNYSLTAWGAAFSGGDASALPALRWLRMESEWCRLAEFSSSGVRLDIRTGIASVSRLSYQDNILVGGNPRRPQIAHSFYLLGQVARIVTHPGEERLSYGCIFLAWCDGDSSRPGWTAIEPGAGTDILPSRSAESRFSIAKIPE